MFYLQQECDAALRSHVGKLAYSSWLVAPSVLGAVRVPDGISFGLSLKLGLMFVAPMLFCWSGFLH